MSFAVSLAKCARPVRPVSYAGKELRKAAPSFGSQDKPPKNFCRYCTGGMSYQDLKAVVNAVMSE